MWLSRWSIEEWDDSLSSCGHYQTWWVFALEPFTRGPPVREGRGAKRREREREGREKAPVPSSMLISQSSNNFLFLISSIFLHIMPELGIIGPVLLILTNVCVYITMCGVFLSVCWGWHLSVGCLSSPSPVILLICKLRIRKSKWGLKSFVKTFFIVVKYP